MNNCKDSSIFLDRLYENFIYCRDNKLNKKDNNSWVNRWDKRNIGLEVLRFRENYEKLFTTLGRGINIKDLNLSYSTENIEFKKYYHNCNTQLFRISDGINLPAFWDYVEYDNFETTVNELREIFIQNSKKIKEEDLCIENFSDIQGEKYKNTKKIIPSLFYKFGLVTDDILHKTNNDKKIFLEIGAGYGGLGNMILNKFKNSKYIILDIQPVISISSYFLYKTGKKIILPNEFENFQKFVNSDNDCLFISPDQLHLIPDKNIDIIINLDSIVELDSETISNYTKEINRLCSDFFYSVNGEFIRYNFFSEQIIKNIKFKKKDKEKFLHLKKKEYNMDFNLTMSSHYVKDIIYF